VPGIKSRWRTAIRYRKYLHDGGSLEQNLGEGEEEKGWGGRDEEVLGRIFG